MHGNIKPPDEVVEVGFVGNRVYRPNKKNEKNEEPSEVT